MVERKYEIILDNEVIATDMNLNTTTILIKALFEHYYAETDMALTIRKLPSKGVINEG